MATARTRQRGEPVRGKPRNDVYVGLLVIALLAQIAGIVFLYMDYSQYPDTKPPKVPDRVSVPSGGGAPAGGPATPPTIPPGGPPGAAGQQRPPGT
jgi:hypothetical protein